MAGHSKWANIKHRKARQDAAKGKAWSKASRAIIVAAKEGGGDPETNLALRYAVEEAKAVNMPKDTIEKAIKKGTGELAGETYEEMRYEGYGPNGVAIMLQCLTDNVNRTAPEIRKIFEKGGGKLGVNGSVSFLFTQRGLILFDTAKVGEERLMELALDAGAEDIQESDGAWEVYTEPSRLHEVREALAGAGLEPESAEVTMIPENTIVCRDADAKRILRLMEELEDHDDVQHVYANFDIPSEEFEKLDA